MMRSVVFAAFDRHNFGDMLFAHVVAALMEGRDVRYAGLVERDLTPWGGHRVEALSRFVNAHVIVAGGEVLTCDAFEAAVMLLPDAEAEAAAARFAHESAERDEWARRILATGRRAPYAPAKAGDGRLIYNGVGGVDLRARSPALHAEVIDSLRHADFIGVRDRVTHEILSSEGIDAALMPDCAALVAGLFGDVIRAHAQRGEAAAVRAAFPGGYIAVQFSADCADDATLGTLAAQLDALPPGCGIVFFRAGIAPWHDALEPYRRAAKRMQRRTHVFESAHLWDICALIAGSRAFCGTSLHGHIVATASGLPAVSFLPPQRRPGPTKQEAYVETWQPHRPGVVALEDIAEGLMDALAKDPRELQAQAGRLAQLARDGCSRWIAMLD